jgi:Cof subfamily protein (haloacid dehalogenase superfamily)
VIGNLAPPGCVGTGFSGEDHRVSAAPRLVATDLDGTIVRSDRTISDRTVAALRAVEAAGSVLVLVTGRPARWLPSVAERIGHAGLAVCANGALLLDLHTERVVESFPMSVDVGLDVAARIRMALPDVTFAVETLGGFGNETSYLPREMAPERRRIGTLDEIFDQPAIKLLARHEELDADQLLAAAREVVGDLAELTHSSIDGLLEISAPGVSKATTLARVCEERGVQAADVVAFGDMPNDLPMLVWAGQSYAVANAHPEVLAAVEQHTASNDDDGVAVVLETWFGGRPPGD